MLPDRVSNDFSDAWIYRDTPGVVQWINFMTGETCTSCENTTDACNAFNDISDTAVCWECSFANPSEFQIAYHKTHNNAVITTFGLR